MQKLVTIEIVTIHAEQDITIRFLTRDHHWCLFAKAIGVFVDYDLHASMTIAQLRYSIGRDPNHNLSLNYWGSFVGAGPGDEVIARPKWCKGCHTFARFVGRN